MSYRTLAEWNARGRQVMKGEKAMGRLNDNTPIFGKEQTKKTNTSRKPFTSEWGYSTDWEEDHEQGLLIGLPGQW
ncbi:hypothetical protein pEaSNUABM55_00191 [Erwinia phage pEa_SNUABM_55]|nr:hypothetical protein pEaSNUABM55_00191 [Erwinia phage pEa_SNUABM_55]